uniref:Pecanex-like protein n=1 Tax=Steinernema glaseri TaxID=37863 RepID=A0A1I8ADZ5_9BILA
MTLYSSSVKIESFGVLCSLMLKSFDLLPLVASRESILSLSSGESEVVLRHFALMAVAGGLARSGLGTAIQVMLMWGGTLLFFVKLFFLAAISPARSTRNLITQSYQISFKCICQVMLLALLTRQGCYQLEIEIR